MRAILSGPTSGRTPRSANRQDVAGGFCGQHTRRQLANVHCNHRVQKEKMDESGRKWKPNLELGGAECSETNAGQFSPPCTEKASSFRDATSVTEGSSPAV